MSWRLCPFNISSFFKTNLHTEAVLCFIFLLLQNTYQNFIKFEKYSWK